MLLEMYRKRCLAVELGAVDKIVLHVCHVSKEGFLPHDVVTQTISTQHTENGRFRSHGVAVDLTEFIEKIHDSEMEC